MPQRDLRHPRTRLSGSSRMRAASRSPDLRRDLTTSLSRARPRDGRDRRIFLRGALLESPNSTHPFRRRASGACFVAKPVARRRPRGRPNAIVATSAVSALGRPSWRLAGCRCHERLKQRGWLGQGTQESGGRDRQTAIDCDDCARDVPRGRREQKRDRFGDLVGTAVSGKGYSGEERVLPGQI